MAQLIDIERVEIGPENLIAQVRIADDAPLMTSEDIEGTARVYNVLPHIVEHACLGDAGETFRDAMPDTEIAHLLEHVTVELLAQTDLAGDMPAGRTWIADDDDSRTYTIELACPDDVLVAAALSSGAWILDWAYGGGGTPEPDIEAIVAGLVGLVESVEGEGEDLVLAYSEPEELPEDEADADSEELPAEEDADVAADEGEEPEPAPATDLDVTTVAPPVEERPLWTPAPEVRRGRVVRAETEPAAPEVEAQIDQIMATIEMAPLTDSQIEQDS